MKSMTPIRFVTLSIVGIFGLIAAASWVAAAQLQPVADPPPPAAVAPAQPQVFVLFVSAFSGERTLKDSAGDFSTRERCAKAAQGVLQVLVPRVVAVSWGCMVLDVSAEYLAQVQAFEAKRDAGPPTDPASSEDAPRKDLKRSPEA